MHILLWGASKNVVESIGLGDRYADISKVISVSILYHTARLKDAKNDDYFYSGSTEMTGRHTGSPLFLQWAENSGSVITSKSVYPEYRLIYLGMFKDEINDALDEWIYFLKNESVTDEFKAEGLEQTKAKSDILAMSDENRKRYDKYMENMRYERGLSETAKEDGIAEGLAKGKAEGTELIVKLIKPGHTPDEALKIALGGNE